jgi:hypothetical protein
LACDGLSANAKADIPSILAPDGLSAYDPTATLGPATGNFLLAELGHLAGKSRAPIVRAIGLGRFVCTVKPAGYVRSQQVVWPQERGQKR